MSAGIFSVKDLVAANREELMTLRGLDVAAVEKIGTKLSHALLL
jgi:hypothetical protein